MKMERFGSPSTCSCHLPSPRCRAVIDVQVLGAFHPLGSTHTVLRALGCWARSPSLLGSVFCSVRCFCIYQVKREARWTSPQGTALKNGREVPAGPAAQAAQITASQAVRELNTGALSQTFPVPCLLRRCCCGCEGSSLVLPEHPKCSPVQTSRGAMC